MLVRCLTETSGFLFGGSTVGITYFDVLAPLNPPPTTNTDIWPVAIFSFVLLSYVSPIKKKHYVNYINK